MQTVKNFQQQINLLQYRLARGEKTLAEVFTEPEVEILSENDLKQRKYAEGRAITRANLPLHDFKAADKV